MRSVAILLVALFATGACERPQREPASGAADLSAPPQLLLPEKEERHPAPGPPPPVRQAAIGSNLDWSYADAPDGARYRVGEVQVTVQAWRDTEVRSVRPHLVVEMEGLPPVRIPGAEAGETNMHRVTVGRWDARRPFVLFQSFTGGAHCCILAQLVVPDGDAWQVVRLGQWDAAYIDGHPPDLNGDGRIDFVYRDNAFLYRFDSYAESFAPPQIINVVDGRAVDVSAQAGFRPLFLRAMRTSRAYCINPDHSPNGACAAYVASAARVGSFDRAWAEMLRSYDRSRDGDPPYPDELRGFLIERGYLRR